MAKEPYELTATQALGLIAKGGLSAVDWVLSCQQRIRDREPEILAWTSFNEHAVEQATARAAAGKSPSIPVGAKDIIDVCGLPTMMGTDFHDPAPVTREGGSVAIMREAGCVFLGKTVTTELGHRHPGPTRNPHNPAHTPGGSSSGSAAAVADLMVPICLGTQTTGSVIRPAAYCGVIGYKPSFGDFDNTGMLANAPSMDTLGILARSIDDIALMRRILLEEPKAPVADVDLRAVTFALLTDSPWETADSETQALIEQLMTDLANAGARIAEVELARETPRLIELHRLISGYEFRRSIAFERVHHFDQLSRVLREGRLADGEAVDRPAYQAALRETSQLCARVREVFEQIDVLISPSATGAAPAGLASTGGASFNAAWSLAGYPAITLPLFAASRSGLPIGCQLIAARGNDDRLLGVSRTILRAFGSG